jgi:hypothetical protein
MRPVRKDREDARRGRSRGKWAEARDPMPFANGRGGSRSKRLATDHPVVRQLIAGQAFSIDSVARWTRCNGRLNGAVVPIRLSTPVTFKGDVPVHGNGKKTAYTEGIAHLRVEHAVFFRIYVDLNRNKVVGIYPEDDGFDGCDGGRPSRTSSCSESCDPPAVRIQGTASRSRVLRSGFRSSQS